MLKRASLLAGLLISATHVFAAVGGPVMRPDGDIEGSVQLKDGNKFGADSTLWLDTTTNVLHVYDIACTTCSTGGIASIPT